MRAMLRTPVGMGACALLALVGLAAVFAPAIWGDAAAAVDTDSLLAPPSAEHLIGTDHLGRDLLMRTLVATRLSVVLALAATGVAVSLGLVLGAAPMLLGGRAGRLAAAFLNVAVAFPGLLLVLFFATVFGVGSAGAVFAIGLAGAPGFGRLCQTLIAGVQERDYVAAARIVGVSKPRVLVRHVLPNIAEPLIVQATIAAGSVLLSFAGLSFLGLGVQAPAYDWGELMNEGLNRIYVNPLAALAPGVAVVIAGLAFNLTGEAAAGTFRRGAGGAGPAEGRAAREAGGPAGRVRRGPEVPAERADAGQPVLRVDGLWVAFPGAGRPVREMSFEVAAGQAVGIVGESGSGKSLTALAIARLLEPPAQTGGKVVFLGADLTDGRRRRKLLGTSMSMVFQDPTSSLNPVRRIGEQLAERARVHLGLGRRAAAELAQDRLEAVRIPDPARRARQHPYQFSGGMRQRAMIGMGLMVKPALLIADEPTTALDVTVQRQVLDLIDSIRAADAVAVILISHDVSLVAERCDRVLVMYAGRLVEDLPAASLGGALHPYTRLLTAAVPDFGTDLTRPLAVIPGRQPEPAESPAGCAFAARCPLADSGCREASPPLARSALGRVACFHAGEYMATSPAEPEARRLGAPRRWAVSPTLILAPAPGAPRQPRRADEHGAAGPGRRAAARQLAARPGADGRQPIAGAAAGLFGRRR